MRSTVTTSEQATVNRRRNRVLAVVLIGGFMGLLDTTIVNVALPSMHAGLGASSSTLEWVVSGYALTYGLLLIPGGRLGDNRGHRRTYLGGLAGFAAASLACGIAQNSAELITARVVQGAAVGIFFPAISGIIHATFTGRERGRAYAMLGATIGLATALGPLLGGVLVDAAGEHEGWRLVFLVNLPIAAVALVAAARLLPRQDASARRRRTDSIGFTLLTLGLLLLLLPLVEGQQVRWAMWTLVSLVAGVAVLIALWRWEISVQRRGREPLLDPRLLRRPAFTVGTVLALIYFAALTSIFFALSLLWQEGLGRDALDTGLVITPFAVGNIASAANSHRIAERLGRGVLLLGTGLATVGTASVFLVLWLDGVTPNGWQLLAPLAVAGVGTGLFIAPNVDFVLRTVAVEDAATVGGTLNTAQRVGSAMGVAAVGTVLFATVGTATGLGTAAAFARGAQLALAVDAGLLALTFLLVLVLPRTKA